MKKLFSSVKKALAKPSNAAAKSNDDARLSSLSLQRISRHGPIFNARAYDFDPILAICAVATADGLIYVSGADAAQLVLYAD